MRTGGMRARERYRYRTHAAGTQGAPRLFGLQSLEGALSLGTELDWPREYIYMGVGHGLEKRNLKKEKKRLDRARRCQLAATA